MFFLLFLLFRRIFYPFVSETLQVLKNPTRIIWLGFSAPTESLCQCRHLGHNFKSQTILVSFSPPDDLFPDPIKNNHLKDIKWYYKRYHVTLFILLRIGSPTLFSSFCIIQFFLYHSALAIDVQLIVLHKK